MPISLVPDEEPTATVEDANEEAEVRAYLASIHSPKLDAIRAKVPTMKTSELIGLACNPDALAHHLGITGADENTMRSMFMAGAIAIGDELDRRIPIPK